MSENISIPEKLRAIYRVATYNPTLSLLIIVFSSLAAALEGIGLTFILPIIEKAQSTGSGTFDGRIVSVFVSLYDFLGVPFTLEYIILGVGTVLVVRYSASFLATWIKAILRNNYVKMLKAEVYDLALHAEIDYFDENRSDVLLNTIVTQSNYAGGAIDRITDAINKVLLSLVYFAVAFYLTPVMSVGTIIFLGLAVFAVRYVIESGYSVGHRVADANEDVQMIAQSGIQGIRDAKLFGMVTELIDEFDTAVNKLTQWKIRLQRNEGMMENAYRLVITLTVFLLVYVGLEFTSLSIGSLGVFLLAIFRLAPQVSALNNLSYNLNSDLPHLVRTQRLIADLESRQEPSEADRKLPRKVIQTTFENVGFKYDDEESALNDVSFSVERGEFIGIVGPSGAGKSTIVSLLTRMYEPDQGRITADGVPINRVDINEWRSRVTVVRQHPHIFNNTLRYNITIGKRVVDQTELDRICEIAQVTEFIDDLPNGYDTVLGDDGVRLSGGQRQRIAVARALLKDADLLVLDEATSDLDSTLETRVHEAIEEMGRDYAMIVIAHRLSTVTNADRIYTMQNGEIVEVGSHSELLSNDGKYAELYLTQVEQ